MTDTQTQAEGINPESLKKASELLMSRRSPNCGENFLKEDAYNAVFIIAELESLVVRERQKNKEMEERIENVKSVAIKNALICLSTEPVWAQKRIKALRDTIKQIGDKELTRRLLETDALGSFGGFLDFLEEEKMELFRKMILARLSPHPPEKEEQG